MEKASEVFEHVQTWSLYKTLYKPSDVHLAWYCDRVAKFGDSVISN